MKSDRERQTDIIVFRVPRTKRQAIDAIVASPEKRIIGIRSCHHFARKLMLDFIDGKLVYLNQRDKQGNPSLTSSIS